ncbi:MAG: hypothetical protein R6V35_03105 [Candidatus Nanohaloarchaea archaeon]
MTQHETAAGFSTLLETMAQMDFFTLVLPFILSYTIFFLALKQVNLFTDQDDDNKFASLIAVVASFFVAQFIATNPWYQSFFVDYFGALTVGLVGILGLFIVLAFAGWERHSTWAPLLGILSIAVAGAAFVNAGGFGEPYNIENDVITNVNWAYLLLDTGLIWIILIGGVLWWLSSDGNESEGNGNFFADMIDAMRGNYDPSEE